MDTARVDIVYRPLRIAWAIHSSDIEGFRTAARLSHTLAGGRFNPIVLADRPQADKIVRTFRADFILPIGDSPEVAALVGRFPHLIRPFFGDGLLHFKGSGRGHCRVVDIVNLIGRWYEDPRWRGFSGRALRHFTWTDDDPLRDAFLAELGEFPIEPEFPINYLGSLQSALPPEKFIDTAIDRKAPITAEIVDFNNIASLARWGVTRHHSISPGWDYIGVYVGDASNIDHLTQFWNIRAADVSVRFVDLAHLDRYAATLPRMRDAITPMIAHFEGHRRGFGVWSPLDLSAEQIKVIAGDMKAIFCQTRDLFGVGESVRPPMMAFGQESALGVIGKSGQSPSISFAFGPKPVASEPYFHDQELVASLSLSGEAADEQHTFAIPYLPEINEVLARKMVLLHSGLRAEPGRTGVVIRATQADQTVRAVPTLDIIQATLRQFGIQAALSNAGLMTRQLITQMGGVDGTRAFKIPGVRRLIKTHGPTASFTKKGALSLICGADPENPKAQFSDYKQLFIEPRDTRSDLTCQEVFSHLVAKGLYRIGAELRCSTCQLESWVPLDQLRQKVTCDLCGAEIDATRQLVEGEFAYRRSGVLGLQRDAQGAVPVSLLLQQLSANVMGSFLTTAIWSPSLDVQPMDESWPQREVDFFIMEFFGRPEGSLTRVAFGECKDKGMSFDANDVETMRRVAAALPGERFEVYILFAKLSPFTRDEIALATDLSVDHRVILLTDQELEPFNFYERAADPDIRGSGFDFDALVAGTEALYPTVRWDPFMRRRE